MDATRVNSVNPVQPAAGVNPAQAVQATPISRSARQFGQILGDTLANAVKETGSLKFSKHASARINSREVDLSPEQLRRVEDGVAMARSKGVADSLVLVDGYALVVNTISRTVVTAMENDGDRVFTNIDGAVVV